MVAFTVAGHWADQRWGTGPWLTLGGLSFGSFIGFRSLWQAAKAANEMEDE